MKTICLLLLFAGPLNLAIAQELARRSFVGLTVEDLDSRVTIKSVDKGGTGSNAGLRSGDEIVSANGQPISSTAEFSAVSKRLRSGERLHLTIIRHGITLTVSATLVPMPFQAHPDFDTLYKAITVDGALYRVIITKPSGSTPRPAVFLIGGLGCYSLDPLRDEGSYGHVLYTLTRDGYVTMRVDKSGEGDSQGPPCDTDASTLQLAADRSIAGLSMLRGLPFVDSKRIFVFAHSLGPVEGALVVGRVPIRGFIAAETIGKSWFDYQTEIARSQPLLLGQTYTEVEAFSRKNLRCLSLFYLQGLSEADVVKAQPDCKDDLPSQAGMPAEFFRDIAKVNLAEEWKRADVPLLVTYGTSDPLTSAEESRYLVDMVNSQHPGRATYIEFNGMSHHFDRQPEQAQALRALGDGNDGSYDPTFVPRIERWMEAISAQ